MPLPNGQLTPEELAEEMLRADQSAAGAPIRRQQSADPLLRPQYGALRRLQPAPPPEQDVRRYDPSPDNFFAAAGMSGPPPGWMPGDPRSGRSMPAPDVAWIGDLDRQIAGQPAGQPAPPSNRPQRPQGVPEGYENHGGMWMAPGQFAMQQQRDFAPQLAQQNPFMFSLDQIGGPNAAAMIGSLTNTANTRAQGMRDFTAQQSQQGIEQGRLGFQREQLGTTTALERERLAQTAQEAAARRVADVEIAGISRGGHMGAAAIGALANAELARQQQMGQPNEEFMAMLRQLATQGGATLPANTGQSPVQNPTQTTIRPATPQGVDTVLQRTLGLTPGAPGTVGQLGLPASGAAFNINNLLSELDSSQNLAAVPQIAQGLARYGNAERIRQELGEAAMLRYIQNRPVAGPAFLRSTSRLGENETASLPRGWRMIRQGGQQWLAPPGVEDRGTHWEIGQGAGQPIGYRLPTNILGGYNPLADTTAGLVPPLNARQRSVNERQLEAILRILEGMPR